MKRYAVTIDLYIHVDNDEEAKKEAERIAHHLRFEAHEPKVVSIHDTPFGKIGNLREVK